MFSWIPHHLYAKFDEQRIFEEMDKIELETRFLEHEEAKMSNFSKFWMTSSIVSVAGITVVVARPGELGMTIGLGIGGITVSTVTLGWLWWKRKTSTLRRTIQQMDRTKSAFKRRKQVYFSISMRLPSYRNPLICRACRITVAAVEKIVQETENFEISSWKSLYSEEIRRIMEKSGENSEILKIEEDEEDEGLDFELVFETLISIFKLHASEYSKFLITDLLKNCNVRKIRQFLRVFGQFREICDQLKEIEKRALKGAGNREKLDKKSEKNNQNFEKLKIGWKEQTSMAIEAILEGLETGNLSRSEVEMALRRTLVVVGSEQQISAEKSENSGISAKIEDENEQGEVKMFEKGERTDVDMVFEGIPLTDAEKQSSRSAIARDVLLDGSEGRKHEKSLFGELKMVLEPRRNDFAKRERKALAKFYGVEESELKEEEDEKEEENFEGVGEGDDVEPEPYDWRKDAEISAGIHREAENLDFLNALASRRVHDDVIE